MNKRDWQADMDTWKAATEGPEVCEGDDTVWSQYVDENGAGIFIAKFERPEDALFYCEAYDALPYWLQQYVAEKARADIAELAYKGLAENAVSRGEYDSLLKKHTAMTKEYWEQKERADQAEAREQMLREAIEEAISRSWGGEMSSLLDIKNALKASLYPKEETE